MRSDGQPDVPAATGIASTKPRRGKTSLKAMIAEVSKGVGDSDANGDTAARGLPEVNLPQYLPPR